MGPTRREPRIDFLHPGWFCLFLGLAAAWVVVGAFAGLDSPLVRLAARVSGYLAAAAMAVPYLHIARRIFRNRRWGPMTAWLRWHIGAAYASCFFLLLHCLARADGWSTAALLYLFWTVMISGVVGFYGQKVLYRLLPLAVEQEVGLERLEPERRRLLQAAAEAFQEYALLTEEDVRDWTALARRTADRESPLYALVYRRLSKTEKAEVDKLATGGADAKSRKAVLDGFNKLLRKPDFIGDASLLMDEDVRDWPGVCAKLSGKDGGGVARRLSQEGLDALQVLTKTAADAKAKTALLKALNELLDDPSFRDRPAARLPDADGVELKELLGRRPRRLPSWLVRRRNRLLLEAWLPDEAVKGSAGFATRLEKERSEKTRFLTGRREADSSERDAIVRNRVLVEHHGAPAVVRAAGPVERFCEGVVAQSLQRPFPGWGWVFTREFLAPVPSNDFLRAKELADAGGREVIEQVEQLVERRRQLDVEFWYHRLGRLWLLFHGPASAALLVLAVDHVWTSIWYGGW